MEKTNSDNNGRIGLLAAGITAFVASICCVGPLVLLSLGVGGAWIGNLTALAPYRPFFMAVTALFLGFAGYRLYHRPKKSPAGDGEDCGCPVKNRKSRFAFWGVTVAIVALFALPYLSPAVPSDRSRSGNSDPGFEKVVLDIENMTCPSCTLTVSSSLTRLDGVREARVTLTPPTAVVIFDKARISAKELVAATTSVGYPSTVRRF
jgi:copper chaperone CopZ